MCLPLPGRRDIRGDQIGEQCTKRLFRVGSKNVDVFGARSPSLGRLRGPSMDRNRSRIFLLCHFAQHILLVGLKCHFLVEAPWKALPPNVNERLMTGIKKTDAIKDTRKGQIKIVMMWVRQKLVCEGGVQTTISLLCSGVQTTISILWCPNHYFFTA